MPSLVSVTAQDKKDTLAFNAFHREQEVNSYQINIDNYTAMLAVLPKDDWPADIVGYRGSDIASLSASIDDVTIQKISDYQYRDKLRSLIRTERVEQSKAQLVLDAIKTQIPTVEYDTLVLAVKTRSTAKNTV